MNKENELQYYLSVSPNKYGIYLFDTKNLKNLYKEEIILNNHANYQNHDELKKFLDDNIFKIEKLSGKFIENIFLILEDKKIFYLEIGIKKKNYQQSINKKILENTLFEVKDLFNKNYHNYKIMHMFINRYLINERVYLELKEDLNCKNFSIEVQFISMPTNFALDIEKVLEEFQIKVTCYLNKNYIESLFMNHNLELSNMAHKTKLGFNKNEVVIVPKNTRKIGFFEKFFQLFS